MQSVAYAECWCVHKKKHWKSWNLYFNVLVLGDCTVVSFRKNVPQTIFNPCYHNRFEHSWYKKLYRFITEKIKASFFKSVGENPSLFNYCQNNSKTIPSITIMSTSSIIMPSELYEYYFFIVLLSVFMLSVTILNVIMLSVTMLNVLAPSTESWSILKLNKLSKVLFIIKLLKLVCFVLKLIILLLLPLIISKIYSNWQ